MADREVLLFGQFDSVSLTNALIESWKTTTTKTRAYWDWGRAILSAAAKVKPTPFKFGYRVLPKRLKPNGRQKYFRTGEHWVVDISEKGRHRVQRVLKGARTKAQALKAEFDSRSRSAIHDTFSAAFPDRSFLVSSGLSQYIGSLRRELGR